ncbi:MAG TPA: hypothetical protein VLY24_16275 [Bryobacteraceae bacterium]|nr:hypothetical protein [Bryobacteraceae bacterium]
MPTVKFCLRESLYLPAPSSIVVVLYEMACPVARRLLKAYHRASLAFREAADLLLTGMLPQDPRFEVARDVMSTANEAVSSAQHAYWQHVREHKCRTGFQQADQRDINERLRRDMLGAREVFDSAVEKHDYLMCLRADLGFTPDGGMALDQARSVRVRAYIVYLEALRRYADYAMLGEPVEEEISQAATPSKPN